MEKTEKKDGLDVSDIFYTVTIKRDTKTVITFVKFLNRLKHPRVTLFMFLTGVMLTAIPLVNDEVATAGVVVCFVMGPIITALAFFRHYVSLVMMQSNPELIMNEELTYYFGGSGIKLEKSGKIENLGRYKDVYCLWEDEKNYYIGMNEDDLLVLPMVNFEEGKVQEFKRFLLDKSKAPNVWLPATFVNQCKVTAERIKKKLSRKK